MIPSAGTPIRIRDIMDATINSCDFEEELKKMLKVRHSLAVNSGTTAFYLILKALKKLSDREDIILPAYTAPSLVLPIRKAGLKYRLADISLDTFNMDTEKAAGAMTRNTLAVLPVHMFGIPVNMGELRGPDGVFIIEDAASSFGTSMERRFTGTFGDVGFVSFNRGKNLSTVAGGLIVTDNDALAQAIRDEVRQLPIPGLSTRIKLYVKACGLSLAVRPWFYTIFRQALAGFKYTALHEDFYSFRYTEFQAALGCRLLKRAEEIFKDREDKGLLLHGALKRIDGIRLPIMPYGHHVVFNQFPFLVEDAEKRMTVIDAIVRSGVEATVLYDRPIHKIYGDGDGPKYPNAEYMAERLVLIPVHHYVPVKSLSRVVETIARTVGR